MDNKRHILILIPTMGSGGAEKVLLNILKKIPYDRYRITLCVVARHGRYLREIPGEVERVYLLRSLFVMRVITYLYTRYRIRSLYRYLVRRRLNRAFDVAVSFVDSSYTDMLFMLPREPGKRITWIHASQASYMNYSRFYRGKRKQEIIERRYSRLDAIVCVSHDSMQEFKSLFGEFGDMRVIYNVLDTEGIRRRSGAFTPSANSSVTPSANGSVTPSANGSVTPSANGSPSLMALGSLLPVKGYERLIEACGRLKEDGVPFRLRIFGEGPLRKQLRQQIESEGVTEEVSLEGFSDNPYPFLSRSDLFVMTSYSEALPTSLCEAMILGRPVLVTNCTGCREIVDNGGYGMMVDQDTEKIYQGIKEMITRPGLLDQYARLARERSVLFDDDRSMEQILSLWQDG